MRPSMKFCGECGTALGATAHRPRRLPYQARQPPSAGSSRSSSPTSSASRQLSEQRDAEDTRELLSRYFDTSRRLIELYGGTVEKFIGDAVMAVWGTPTATEDDAERAVRAALDLVAAVSALGDEVGAPELRARAGVLTGEAAVTIGAEGQGMVAGDLVNTASRIQSAAEPGTVFVGEATRRATEQAIVYEDAGSLRAQGQGRARTSSGGRCASSREPRGSLKSHGARGAVRRPRPRAPPDQGPLPRLGRGAQGASRLGHRDRRHRQVAALLGVLQVLRRDRRTTVYWHRGRCLSYGEGVTYWALADMVRMRCRHRRGRGARVGAGQAARRRSRSTSSTHEERRFVEPRLAHLLGLAERQARDQQDLFAAWRLFFERLAESYPTVLAFEDMQWADASLLDFVEYLLDWSRSSPDLRDHARAAGAAGAAARPGAPGSANFTSLYLEPLSQQAMEELLAGLVPGLPVEVRDRILDSRRGHPALRGRDRADAARPRPARPGRALPTG